MSTTGEDVWVRAQEVLPTLSNVHSFVSGDGLPRIKPEYFFRASDRKVRGNLWFGPGAEGMPEYVHGAAIAGVLDEGLGLLAWYLGYRVATRDLSVQYHRFVPTHAHALIEGQLEDELGWLVRGRATLTDDAGEIYAVGKAAFVELKPAVVEELARRNAARSA